MDTFDTILKVIFLPVQLALLLVALVFQVIGVVIVAIPFTIIGGGTLLLLMMFL